MWPSVWGRSMSSDQNRTTPLGLRISAIAGLLFLHLPLALILLYAFTTEEKSYQFPPPGLAPDLPFRLHYRGEELPVPAAWLHDEMVRGRLVAAARHLAAALSLA